MQLEPVIFELFIGPKISFSLWTFSGACSEIGLKNAEYFSQLSAMAVLEGARVINQTFSNVPFSLYLDMCEVVRFVPLDI